MLGLLATAGLSGLAGCGFKPVYGAHSAGKSPSAIQQFAAIEIPPMPNRLGQQMRNMLIDSLHPSGADTDYRYKLDVNLGEAVIDLGLQQNSTSTRGQVRITAKYALIDNSNGKVVLSETLRTSTGYNILINQFSSVLSQADAETQGLQQISDDMTLHLAMYFTVQDQLPTPAPEPAPKKKEPGK
ncbi:MAG TPA: LPS assembly lipoprotein LptE [Alphaproteobacteria bacterium]|nr:LPS assembly lipoprotein LptE [Alphaproteobacteria bacterium]